MCSAADEHGFRQVYSTMQHCRTLYAWDANGQVGLGEIQHLFGTQHAAVICVGMSPDCSNLGLDVWEISIVALLQARGRRDGLLRLRCRACTRLAARLC